MIQLTFKNVGQGDSIILEWQDNNIPKLCIIDCNLYHGQNPILEYIIEKKIKAIDFLILSHPHLDHFSGFLQVLEYCELNSIKISYFLHTCSQVPSFLQSATNSAHTEIELQKLFLYLFRNHKKLGIKVASIQGNSPCSIITLSKDYFLKILSPTLEELNNYIQNAYYPFNEEESLDNPKANWLSTIIKIECKNWYFLLTSDAIKSSLIRIDKHESSELENLLILGQIPHHGAFGNHNNTFWKKRNRIDGTAMVVSTGTNSYGHPSEDVIKFFKNNRFRVFSTSDRSTYGLGNSEKIINEISANLDIYSFSESADNSILNGDKFFTLTADYIGFN